MQAICTVADVVQVVCILQEGHRDFVHGLTLWGFCFTIEKRTETRAQRWGTKDTRQPCSAGLRVSLLDKKVLSLRVLAAAIVGTQRQAHVSAALSGFVLQERPMTGTLRKVYLRHHHQVTGVRQRCSELADSDGEGLACAARVTETCLVQIAVGLCEYRRRDPQFPERCHCETTLRDLSP